MFSLLLATDFSLQATNLTQLHPKIDSGNTLIKCGKNTNSAVCSLSSSTEHSFPLKLISNFLFMTLLWTPIDIHQQSWAKDGHIYTLG